MTETPVHLPSKDCIDRTDDRDSAMLNKIVVLENDSQNQENAHQ